MSGYEELIASKGTETPVAEAPPVEVVSEPASVVEAPVTSEPVAVAPSVTAPTAAPTEAAPSLDAAGILRAMHEERDQRQAAQRELNAIRARVAEQERKAREAAAEAPDYLENPQEFIAWVKRENKAEVERAVAAVRSEHSRDRETLSRTMVEQHLGAEKFGELEKFINAAPDNAHAIALKQPHPYGWFLKKFSEAQEHKKTQDTLKQLQGKSIDEIVAERVAAALAAQPTAATPAAVVPAPADTRARNADGTFAPTLTSTRHEPPSLSLVAAAQAPRGEDSMGGYDAMMAAKQHHQKRG